MNEVISGYQAVGFYGLSAKLNEVQLHAGLNLIAVHTQVNSQNTNTAPLLALDVIDLRNNPAEIKVLSTTALSEHTYRTTNRIYRAWLYSVNVPEDQPVDIELTFSRQVSSGAAVLVAIEGDPRAVPLLVAESETDHITLSDPFAAGHMVFSTLQARDGNTTIIHPEFGILLGPYSPQPEDEDHHSFVTAQLVAQPVDSELSISFGRETPAIMLSVALIYEPEPEPQPEPQPEPIRAPYGELLASLGVATGDMIRVNVERRQNSPARRVFLDVNEVTGEYVAVLIDAANQASIYTGGLTWIA